MRIVSIHIDGYGVLSDWGVDDLGPGLSVIHGPNEAGKSTLLEFVRGVLFGFSTRRSRPGFHAPLRGGRHGGTVRLASDDGEIWTLERHVDARAPILTAPDGSLASEDRLLALLRGADDKLFRSVFAFGLGELSSFETLERDEVQDLVFSAGVLGAGRSATRASRLFETRRSALVRPRQQDAVANKLRMRIDEVSASLRTVRLNAESFPRATLEVETLRRHAHDIRESCDNQRLRSSELDRLMACWPISRRLVDAKSQLDKLCRTNAQDRAISEREETIKALSHEHSGHDERVRKRAALEAQLAGIRRDLIALFDEFGDAMNRHAIDDLDLGHEARDRIQTLTQASQELRGELRLLEERYEAAAEESTAATDALQRDPAIASTRDESVLRELLIANQQLRQCVTEHERIGAQHESAIREARLARMAERHPTSRAIAQSMRYLVALLAAVCVAGAAVLGERHQPIAAGILVIGVFVLFWACSLAQRKVAGDGDEPSNERQLELDRLSEQITTLAGKLGLQTPVFTIEIDSFATRLELERSDRHRLDELARDRAAAQQRLELARSRLLRRRQDCEGVAIEIANEAKKLGLDGSLSADGLTRAFDRLLEARSRVEAEARVTNELALVTHQIELFEQTLVDTAHACGLACSDEPSFEVVAGLMSELSERSDHIHSEAIARRELERSIERAEQDLAEALGSGVDAQRLHKELATGAVISWEEERSRLAREIEEITAQYESAIAALTDAERALEQLAQSDEVARLELEHESLTADLDAALEEWTVLGIAKSLLERTLARYERERQPLVISRAGALFSSVTAGRYDRLVARENDEGARRHGIEAITANGSRVESGDLSRGTAEQLYLCLRLGFAVTFAERAVSLPLILDDVLVNFDPERATAVALAIAKTAEQHQVLAFTCHPHVVAYFGRGRSESAID